MVTMQKEVGVYLRDLRIAIVIKNDDGFEVRTVYPIKPYTKQVKTAEEVKELCEVLAGKFLTHLGNV